MCSSDLTLPYHPRVVVFQCGGNDINAGDPVEAPIARIREYLARLRKENPDCAVVFIATTGLVLAPVGARILHRFHLDKDT